MRYFKDERSDAVISLTDLQTEYKILKQNKETDAENFNDYLNNCLSKNGTLTEI